MNIKPIGKRVLVKLTKKEEKNTSKVLLLPNDNFLNYEIGEVLAVSSELSSIFSLGVTIIFKKDSGIKLSSYDESNILVDLDNILGVIEK